jgi:UDP-N-acetylglucosamine 1-carboxyvinyltransferase
VDRLIIEGAGPLQGSLRIGGAKNAILPVMAAALLTEQTLALPDCPQLVDVSTMVKILRSLGVAVERHAGAGGRGLELCAQGPLAGRAGWDLVRQMRASVCLMGPLLARLGRCEVSMPGGCVIGVRPIDVHLKGFEALGARLRIERGFVVAEAPPGGLRGAEMFLGTSFGSSVTGTENVMMAAALARGRTVIHGAACEPEVEDLGRCLNAMGARISGLGSPTVVVDGVEELGGAVHEVIPDRIEAGTYLLAGAITGGGVRVENCRPAHLQALLDRMTQAGIPFECGPDWIEVFRLDKRPRPTDVTTQTYPGFPTDLQAQWMALMCLADGISVVTERIYPDRYMHVAELNRLGARIRRQESSAVVQGVAGFSGAPITASDLRASAALVMAGLVARGQTEVHRVYHIDRGYERIEERLRQVGAKIRRER